MLMPSIFGETILDDFFDFPRGNRKKAYSSAAMMKTDITENDAEYELTMDLPGFSKEDVQAKLEDGYLSITASTSQNDDKQDANGNYIRRERYSGTCSRSFYVGENVTQEDIKAKFENGTLKLIVPKKEEVPKVEENKFIQIEG